MGDAVPGELYGILCRDVHPLAWYHKSLGDTSPHRSSGTPNTLTSSTPGRSMITFSTSWLERFSPPEIMMSRPPDVWGVIEQVATAKAKV